MQLKDTSGVRVRQLGETNMALMTKLCWRLMKEPDSTWRKILTTEYGGNQSSLNIFQDKQSSSNFWWGMVRISNIIRKSARWVICDGQSVYFWKDIWNGSDPLTMVALQRPMATDFSAAVVDHWEVGNGWRWKILGTLLHATILLQLASIAVSGDSQEKYYLGWNDIQSN